MTRVYVPLTLAELGGLLGSGSIAASPQRYVAVDESEEAEYDALSAAAEEAVGQLDGPGRRAVVVADIPDPDGAFGLDRVVAVHADTEPVDPSATDLPELGWFATQEIPDLLSS